MSKLDLRYTKFVLESLQKDLRSGELENKTGKWYIEMISDALTEIKDNEDSN